MQLLKSATTTVTGRLFLLSLCGFACLIAQSVQPAPEDAQSFDEVVDRAINSEHILLSKLKGKQPIVETYIQQMKSDSDLGLVPEHDFYFLGKLDMTRGFVRESFLPTDSSLKRAPHFFTSLLSTEYHPLGFAYEIFIDARDFDRAHYRFQYVRREFLGDVRCVVMDVGPQPNAGKGRFQGRIWVEDRDYNIVRFEGTYAPSPNREFVHFDSWRVNTGPGLWLPSNIYAEDEQYGLILHTPPMRAQTRLWNYEPEKMRSEQAFTNLTVDVPQGVRDESDASSDNSPIEARRMWESQAEENMIDRLQQAGLLAPPGEVDQVLDTVLNNLEVTNKISIDPPVRVRILLTTPLESVAVNHTILISRGLIDVLPDEACLAAVLAHELSHILSGDSVNTRYAFADRLLFEDASTLKRVSIARTEQEELAADAKAIEILKNSPYKDDLRRVGLFLRMLSLRSNEVPHLIRPLLGNHLAQTGKDLRLSGLMELSPGLQLRNTEEIAALPLGSRVKMDPWSNQLRLMKSHNVRLLSAKEKLPFQITPFMLHLTREDSNAAGTSTTGPGVTSSPQ
ncbi:MAG: M48 family metalloprotease [Acidobacteriaceae bacterium]|nr:M48 family metalloprotease [Acidobacteriaceae bacterium]MBV9766672.1 M48 family metalloprotease [Acidobacteriaceae bacterium]